jgi:membrane-bound lytic murein transglycosylase A
MQAIAQERTPTVRLRQSIDFVDDLRFENLNKAIERQLVAFDVINLRGTIRFGTKTYPKTALRDSLLLLKKLSQKATACRKTGTDAECLSIFKREMNAAFNIYVPIAKNSRGRQMQKPTKFTSYYSPDLSGSRVRTERFKHGIYTLPENPADQNFTRVEIDFKGALDGKGADLFWVEDSLYDIYLLHVQGGGRITLHNEDGTKDYRYLSYKGKNSRSFQMVYHYMKQKGYLSPSDAGVVSQRRFLEEHPEKQEEVFNSCPSYVYFKESLDEPVGLDNIPLTEGRSVAVDSRIYKSTGLINFIKAKRPSHVDQSGQVVKIPFSRFYISQDTGGAIRGNARCDLYAGYGPMAEIAAYNTDDMGEQYFLIQK